MIVCRVAKATAMSREFLAGLIIAYPYLWAWHNDRGETEGRKSSPTCVVVALRGATDGLTHLALPAVTTHPPRSWMAGRIDWQLQNHAVR